jgi:hypothetical protein
MPPNPQRKLPLHATRPADRTLQGRHSSLIEQGAVTECERKAYHRDRADPDVCNHASEGAWRNPFPGATQGISTTDDPSSSFAAKQPVFR